MKILITGSNGLLGNAIQKVSSEYYNKKHQFIFTTRKDADLTNYNETYKMIFAYKPDVVIHLAANVGGLFKNLTYKVQMLEDNLHINTNIIKACHENNVNHFIGILSTCIFPDNSLYPISEKDLHNGPPHESNAEYAYAKRMMEIQCQAYYKQYKRQYYCVIPTNIYGPYDNFDIRNGHVIPSLIHKCYLSKSQNLPFIVSGTGKPLRQFIFSFDLARIILFLAIEYNNVNNESIIISVPEHHEISIKDIAYKICTFMNYYNIQFDTSKSDGQYKKTADNSKLIKIIEEKKKYIFTSIDEGLEYTIQWFLKKQL